MIFLDKFSSYLQKKKKSNNSIKGYINFSKKYTGQYGGIRISSDDMQNYDAILIDQEGDGDLEPLIHNELRQILDNTPNHRRKAFYIVLKNIGCRISEGLQLKKYFDLSRNPPAIFLPK